MRTAITPDMPRMSDLLTKKTVFLKYIFDAEDDLLYLRNECSALRKGRF